uniref:Uncharacterized protein n=1 Tax=Anguilla anguilla TaxID=7936 RepID=A0A0E9TDR0_ANGAN
MKPILQKE